MIWFEKQVMTTRGGKLPRLLALEPPTRQPVLVRLLSFVSAAATLRAAVAVIVLACLAGLQFNARQSKAEGNDTTEHSGDRVVDPVITKSLESGNVAEVIVQLRISPEFKSEAGLPRERAEEQRAAIADGQQKLIRHLAQKLPALDVERIRTFRTAPFLALTINTEVAAALVRYPGVLAITPDLESRPMNDEELGSIGALRVHRALSSVRFPSLGGRGLNSAVGSSQTIAIIDTGIDASHPMLSSAVVAEACFSSSARSCVFFSAGCRDTHTTHCPSGSNRQEGAGSARHCAYTAGCNHGTGMAGIAAGRAIEFQEGAGQGSPITRKIAGVAPGARLISINAFRRKLPNEVVALQSDIAAALEHVLALSEQHDIAAVLLAAGMADDEEAHDTTCDGSFRLLGEAIANLRSKGIATIVPYHTGSTASDELGILPFGCLSDVVRVGESDFLIRDRLPDDLGPHVMARLSRRSASPGAATAEFEGLSVAAAYVAGSWAVMKSVRPGASVAAIVSAIQRTDQQVAAPDDQGEPRLHLGRAVGELMSNPVFLRPSDLNFEISPLTSRIFRRHCRLPVFFEPNAVFDRSNRYFMEAQNLTTASPLDTLVDQIGENRWATADSFALFNFRSGHRYRLTARTCTLSGDQCSANSVAYDLATPQLLPRPPVNFHVASAGHRQVTVAWSPARQAESWLLPDHFSLQLDGSGAHRTVRLAPEENSFVFSNLRPGSLYRIRLSACMPYCNNQHRCHPDYRHLNASTRSYTVPDAPSHLRVCIPPITPVSSSTVDVVVSPRIHPCARPGRHYMWTDNSDGEAYFRFEYRAQAPVSGNRRPPFNSTTWSHARAPANLPGFTLPALSAGLYEVRVKACNHVNDCSNASNTLSITVD